MSLSNQFKNLTTSQINSLNETLLNASIAFEGGGNYREIFRRAKLSQNGPLLRIYEMLEHAPCEEIEKLSKSFVIMKTV